MAKNGTDQDPHQDPDVLQVPGDLLYRLAEVPDLLVTSELMLRPLARGDNPNIPGETCEAIGQACDQLHMALTRVLEVLRNVPGTSVGSDEALPRPSAHSVDGASKTAGRRTS